MRSSTVCVCVAVVFAYSTLLDAGASDQQVEDNTPKDATESKPPPPIDQDTETQTWTAKDGRKIEAKFVSLDGESVVIEKDGEKFTVPFSNLEAWSVVQAKKLGGLLETTTVTPPPQKPDEVPAMSPLASKLEAFIAILSSDPIASKIVKNVSVAQSGDRWTATITVQNVWHLRAKQVRLQDAQTFWKAWAVIASANNLDMARIKMVDLNGNEVGGSRLTAGSMLWVQD